MDGKPLTYRRNSDKEESLRLFSFSSYDTYVDKSNNDRMRNPGGYGAPLQRGDSATFGSDNRTNKHQHQRKRKSQFEEYDESGEGGTGDY